MKLTLNIKIPSRLDHSTSLYLHMNILYLHMLEASVVAGPKKKLIKFRFVLGTFQQYSKLKIRSSGFPSRFTCGTICKLFTYQKVDYILPHVYEFFVLLNFSHAIVK